MERSTMRRTCIACPRGCLLTIEMDGPHVMVSGNACPKGEDYGLEEAVQPRRILTTTVRTAGAERPRLPVRSSGTVPLAEIRELMAGINDIVVTPPLHCGDTVAANLLGRGVDLIATDELE